MNLSPSLFSAPIDLDTGPLLRVHEAPDEVMRAQIWGVLTAMYPHVHRTDRRREERFPYPRLVSLTPVDADGTTPIDDTMMVAGKHLSERGLGFYHPSPLPHRLMIASLEKVEDTWLNFLLDVNWCRFNRHGWYESGGRFLRPMPRLME